MATLSVDPDYLRRLVVKIRAFMGKEATELPDEGSNPTDDEMPSSALQDEADDLSREERWWKRLGGLSHASRPNWWH